MDNDSKYTLTFFADDSDFSYVYGTYDHVEYAFRNARLFGLTWTMDGDGWTSSRTLFAEAKKYGNWYVARTPEV